MNVLKDLLNFPLGHLCIELPLKLFFVVDNVFIVFWMIRERFLFGSFVCWPPFRMETVCKFFDSIWLLLLSWIIFCGDGFDGGAGKICLCTGMTCCGGVMWSFFKEATSFSNRFVSEFSARNPSLWKQFTYMDLKVLITLFQKIWFIDIWATLHELLKKDDNSTET